jgi:uncharacterized glyoxalase superfamily metalloenzyme YdcJ
LIFNRTLLHHERISIRQQQRYFRTCFFAAMRPGCGQEVPQYGSAGATGGVNAQTLAAEPGPQLSESGEIERLTLNVMARSDWARQAELATMRRLFADGYCPLATMTVCGPVSRFTNRIRLR